MFILSLNHSGMRQSTCTRSQAAQPRAALRSMTHLQSAADAQHSHGVAANLLHNSVTINARDGHHLGTGSRAKSHHQGLRVINTRVYVDDQFHTTLFTLFRHFLSCQRSSLKETEITQRCYTISFKVNLVKFGVVKSGKQK